MTPARVEEYGRSIYDYTYIFNVNDTPYQGESFDYQRKLRVGDPVTILYDDNDPHVSEIQGQRFQALGADSLGVVLVPLFMLLALLYRISTALRKVDVVRNGRYGTAKIISKTLIKGRGQRNIAYEVTFLFTDEAGEKHTGRARKAYSSTVLNGTLEPVMYLSGQPQKAVLLDTLPAVVREFIERPQGAV